MPVKKKERKKKKHRSPVLEQQAGIDSVVRQDRRGLLRTVPSKRKSQVCCEDGQVLPGSPDAQCCGNKTFDPSSHTCCHGYVSPGGGLSCCGQIAYSRTNASCCAGQLSKEYNEMVSQCCGTKAYYHTYDLCCGDELYNLTTHTCCGAEQNIILKKNTPNDKCCGSTLFNEDTHTCSVDMTIISKGSSIEGTGLNGGQCCNSKGYNPNLDMCCSGVIHTLKPGIHQECCGGSAYDIKSSVCCNGTLYQATDGETVCSGGIPFNPTNETVCGKVTHESGQHCCGNHIFKPLTDICCRGKSHPRTNTGLLCCGSQPYNPANSSFKCCNGKLHALSSHPRSWGCCGEGLIDLQTHECCSSKDQHLVFKKDSEFSCCGHHHYKTSLDSCCAGRLIQKHKQAQSTGKACRLVHIADIEDSAVCNKRVLMGRMHSLAIQHSRRVYVMIDVLEVMKNKSAVPLSHPTIITVDHCLCPLLNLGATYALWIPHNMTIDSVTLENSVEMTELSHLESCPVFTILQVMDKCK
ncbi:Galaxin [Acipenser ruthenus]|uniref:Galaxin n=1 Tax=Acipenser ruthenus TaxID=7906 RepID=A0A444TX18_ACIRT|nr:Galaxin [Acipenser ruthenus]